MLQGVLHVHSTFSDGNEPLETVVETFGAMGLDFVAVSDHAEVFDDARMQDYVRRCESLSSASFTVIPGLEFALLGGSLHTLGYGVRRRVRAPDLDKLVDGIHEERGLAVLAHPPTGSINLIASVKNKLDGIEVWNARYDGTFAPRVETFQLLRRIRAGNPGAFAFGGIDLHAVEQARKPIVVQVDTSENTPDSILEAMRAGQFTVRGGRFAIPATGELTFVQELSIAVRQPLCRRRAG
jgi:hypothetical protein